MEKLRLKDKIKIIIFLLIIGIISVFNIPIWKEVSFIILNLVGTLIIFVLFPKTTSFIVFIILLSLAFLYFFLDPIFTIIDIYKFPSKYTKN